MPWPTQPHTFHPPRLPHGTPLSVRKHETEHATSPLSLLVAVPMFAPMIRNHHLPPHRFPRLFLEFQTVNKVPRITQTVRPIVNHFTRQMQWYTLRSIKETVPSKKRLTHPAMGERCPLQKGRGSSRRKNIDVGFGTASETDFFARVGNLSTLFRFPPAWCR